MPFATDGMTASDPAVPEARLARWGRIGLWLLLLCSWVVAVWYMWDAMSTVPSPERLEQSRMVTIPTPRTFLTSTVFSAMELAVVLAALWPWWKSLYATRLGITDLALVTWFVMTTPMDLNRMDWIHRRWLALLVLTVSAALLVLAFYRGTRRLLERRQV